MRNRRFLNMIGALATALAGTSADAAGPDAQAPEPQFLFEGVPVRFVSQVTNKFFPLVPGTKFFYEGTESGDLISDEMFVTFETKEILGVKTTVVRDRAFQNGVLAELTFDWYAQDAAGNVWYFGEDSRELDAEGNVTSRHGSWEAGVDGAQPGIIMKADPQVGDRYFQEFAPGVAEDAAEVRNLEKAVCVPYACFEDVLSIQEFSRLSPGVIDRKFYASGVGFVLAKTIKGGDEWLGLVRITTVAP